MISETEFTTSERRASGQRFNSIALISVFLLAVLFAVYSTFDRQNAFTSGKQIANQISEHTSLVVAGTLDSTRQILRAMEILINPPMPKGTPDPARVRSALLKLKAQSAHIMDLLIIDQRGKIQHWTGNGAPPDVIDRAYFSFHQKQTASGLYVSEPMLSKVHAGRWFFALSEAIRDDQGELIQVIVAIVDVSLMHQKLSVQFAIPGSSQALLAEDGTIYARNPDNAAYLGKKVVRPRELAALTGNQQAMTIVSISQLDQKERILAFHRLESFPLVAVGTIIVDELLADWRQRMMMLIGLWLAICAAAVLLARRANSISHAQIELANVDPLTGVANRRSIMHAATRLERSAKHTGALSLLMIDIDRFKSINDRFGHQVGDEVIRLISGVLRTQIRNTDFLGRYGGEEFLVLMPDTGIEGAMQVAEKLRKAVAEKVTRPVSVTVSIGAASKSDNDVTLDRTLSRADHALYQAKATGRNRVQQASEELPQIER